VSLVGSLMFVKLLGYSLNLITLFAIILAIGIVVDNAIVVVEAIEAELAASGVDARTGSKRAMGQIRGAIVSITLVMSAVFVPIAFASGPTGIFMKQFCLTMAAAIVLSGVIALTLTPALCARYLQPHAPSGGSPGPLMRGLNAFDRFFRTTERGYLQALKRFLGRPAVLVALFLVCTSGAGLVMGSLPTGFIPQEDAGVFYASVTTPPGSTLERTKEVVDRIQSLTADVPGILTTTTLAGTNVLSDGTGATYGTVQFGLADWSQRAPIETIIDRVAERIESIKSAEIELFPPPSVPGYGNSSGFELRVLDKTGSGDLGQLQEVIDEFLIALRKRPEIAAAFTMFEASFPQYTIDIDQSRASRYGVSVEDVMQELQILLGGEYAVNFIRFGRMYKVMLQALPKFRRTPEDLLNLRVRNAAGEFVALSEIAGLEKTYGADQVTRYNMFASAEVTGLPAPGFSSGEALKAVQAVAATSLPPGFGIDWAGMAKDELEAGNEGLVLIGICLVFVYLLLAAQYESFLLPLPVILALPAGLLGAGLGLAAFGLENNIYARASILMLIGLLGKNAILIIEYASQGQRRGLGKREAILAAAEARFRAIVMTSAALVAGLIPLLFSSGVGAIGNRTVGSSAVGGMVVGTLLGLFLVPGLFMLCARGAVERRKETQSRHAEAHGELGVGVSA
jgi:HAE1 family hydrophobic/amphiphilic exporter-1